MEASFYLLGSFNFWLFGFCWSLRCRAIAAAAATQANPMGHRTARFRIGRCNHRIISLQIVPLAIFFWRQSVRRKVSAKCLVWLAIDHADDVIFARERLSRGHCRSVFHRGSFRRARFDLATKSSDRIVHRLQKRWHVISRCPGVGVTQPCDGQFGGEFDRVGFGGHLWSAHQSLPLAGHAKIARFASPTILERQNIRTIPGPLQ